MASGKSSKLRLNKRVKSVTANSSGLKLANKSLSQVAHEQKQELKRRQELLKSTSIDQS